MVTTRLPKTIVKLTALGPVANTDTKLLIYGLFQKGRVLAQDGVVRIAGQVRQSHTARVYGRDKSFVTTMKRAPAVTASMNKAASATTSHR